MNTMTFIFGQLIPLEALSQRPPLCLPKIQTGAAPLQIWKEKPMDNGILLIAFLVVSLIANFAMSARVDGK